jgi:pheromone shutdown-related protein TraB
MITLIGTGHVFDLVDALQGIFHQKKPDILCVELDKQRYHALLTKQQDPLKYEESAKKLPFLYRMLARFQDNIAKRFGVTPGEEMLTAISYAKTYQIPLMCIDMEAQLLFKRMIKAMSFREKMSFLFSGIAGLFVKSETVEKQVENISKDIESYLDVIGKKFPTIKKILIDERNQYMVHNLMKIKDEYQQIICIIGDGHVPGISKLLKEKIIDHDVIRLHDLQNSAHADLDTSTASFHIEYE